MITKYSMYASFSSPANSIGLMQPLWRPCDKVDTWTDVIRAKDGSPKLGTWGLTAMLILYYTIGNGDPSVVGKKNALSPVGL